MSKAAVQNYLCLPFCSFYRTGAKEEMACQGALVLAELVKRGRLSPEKLPASKEKERRRWQVEDKELERALCRLCPFALDGCDFHSAHRSVAAEPCGGYLLLQLLKDQRTITGSDLKVAPCGASNVA